MPGSGAPTARPPRRTRDCPVPVWRTVSKTAQRSGTFDALKVRDFALLWSGQMVSSFGVGVFTVALALVALRIGHRPIDLAYVLTARAVPTVVLALVGGVVVDR